RQPPQSGVPVPSSDHLAARWDPSQKGLFLDSPQRQSEHGGVTKEQGSGPACAQEAKDSTKAHLLESQKL
ncbi:MAG: hypothetical protein NWR52_02165, partial [Paracoccaceae bacterium]|nr:hypothetical protein [Paracoccaceae bacterium]